MIKAFRHRGLRELYQRGKSSKVAQGHVPKLCVFSLLSIKALGRKE